ncbi:MAG: hypothetical protein ACFCGT_21580 [Sandaracinaceae bacterium]
MSGGPVLLVAALYLLAGMALAVVAMLWQQRRTARRTEAWDLYRLVADEVGGLEVVATAAGWPRLRGRVDGVEVEIDDDNHLGRGSSGLLGLRCRLPELEGTADVALWLGPAPAFFADLLGPPKSLGDRDLELYDLFTRAEGGGSDWWQDVVLLETLRTLPGGRVWKRDDQLLVLFDHLEADVVRSVLTVPGLLRHAASRPTLH